MSPNVLYIIIASVFTLVIGFDIYKWLKHNTFSRPEIKAQRFKSTINASILILALTSIIISISFHVNIFKYKRPISYAGINNITLQDFKGFRLPNQTLDGNSEFAFITTTIEWSKNGNELMVESVFHPSRSYVFNENIVDKFLLQHELYHFHITEYFARQCRKGLKEFKQMPDHSDIESIMSVNSNLERETQRAYDDNTYHGYVLKEQKQWQQKLDSLLTLDQNFSKVKIKYE
jgi:hypothetical protein